MLTLVVIIGTLIFFGMGALAFLFLWGGYMGAKASLNEKRAAQSAGQTTSKK